MREVVWLLNRSFEILSARGKTSSLSEACRARPGKAGEAEELFLSVSHNATPPRVLCLRYGVRSTAVAPAQQSGQLSGAQDLRF
jgi:hypothetical protein